MTTVTPGNDNTPRRRTNRRCAATLEEVEFYLRWTADNSYAVARALGIQRDSLYAAVALRGRRPDLWDRLTARDVDLEGEQWYSKEWLPESDPRRHRSGWSRSATGPRV